MRPFGIVLVSALSGGVAGACLAWTLHRHESPSAETDVLRGAAAAMSETSSQTQRTATELRRLLEAIRTDSALGRVPGTPAPKPHAEAPTVAAPPLATTGTSRPQPGPLPPPREDLLADLYQQTDDDPATMRHWLLLDERAVQERFGIPDRIYISEAGAEVWQYFSRSGSGRNYRLTLSRGRLISLR